MNATKERQAWCCLQVKLCDPCLSALYVPCCEKALYKYSSFPFSFLFNKLFFRLSIHALVVKIQPMQQSCPMVPRWRSFGDFLSPVFLASRVQHISDLHPKQALRPHHVWMVGIQSATAENRRGKKIERKKKERRSHRTKI